MTYLCEKLNISLHHSGESDVVALDISKAFDRVWHAALLAKCRALGLGRVFLKWIGDFLSNRTIRVLVDGLASDKFELNAGVPQGSVLSPTLFLIFINDLLSLTSNPIHSFADDSTLVASYEFHSRCNINHQVNTTAKNFTISELNNDLAKIHKWGENNRVQFNTKKTQCCLISRKIATSIPNLIFQGEALQHSTDLNILGIELNQKLTWSNHIFGIAKDAARCLGFLYRCKTYFSPLDLLNIYKTYIRPKAGAPQSALGYLDKMQNRAIRLINDPNVTSTLT